MGQTNFFASEEEKKKHNQNKLDEFNSHSFSVIYRKYLTNGLFHSTTLAGFAGILKSECIKPNIDKFPITFPQTLKSFGYIKGYVCLFDFRSSVESEIIHYFWKFDTFFCNGWEIKIILEINEGSLKQEIIPNDANPPSGKPGHKYYIPRYEVWYDGNIPVAAISKIIFTGLRNGEFVFDSFSSIESAYKRLLEL